MDIILILALAIGLIYFLSSAARWAFKLDSQTPKRSKPKRRQQDAAAKKAVDDVFFDIIRPIWKRPPDERHP